VKLKPSKPPPLQYDHCVLCGAPKRLTANPYCRAHRDLAQ
jgi:hypothetical protein